MSKRMTAALPPHPPSDLRPYQRAAIDAVLAARRAGRRRLLVHLPTGAGKTVIFSHLAQARAAAGAGARPSRGAADAGAGQAGSARWAATAVVAIERGALRASADAKVLVCSIRSLHEERLARVLRGRDVGLIIYDECHHAAAEDNLRVLRQLGVFEPAFDGHAARLHRHDRARRRPGARRGLRGDRLLARPARADRRRLPGAAARLPDLDHGGSAPALARRASTSTRRSWPRRSTSRSATRWSRGRSRSWRAIGARSRSA